MPISTEGELFRVVGIEADGSRAYIELKASRTGWVDDPPDTWAVGDVMLLEDDGRTSHPVPSSLWPEPRDVGVVRLAEDDLLLVESDGRLRLIPAGGASCKVGNTVEFGSATGVSRIVSENAIRARDDDLETDSIVAGFRLNEDPEYGFENIGGLEGVVKRARELIEIQLERSDAIQRIGAKPVKGVLFTGPPGTGKTMLARVIAKHAGAAFFQISGPEVFSKWYGESEQILRRLFEVANAEDRAIIFFDEIDSVAGKRDEGAHEASKRVVAQLLTLMDGFKASRTIVIAATNRPEDIDAALRRPGRFDWEINFPLPDDKGRLEILKKSSSRIVTKGALPYDAVAAATDGWSAADLTAVWSEAALFSVADGREFVSIEDFLVGFERVGRMRESRQEA